MEDINTRIQVRDKSLAKKIIDCSYLIQKGAARCRDLLRLLLERDRNHSSHNRSNNNE